MKILSSKSIYNNAVRGEHEVRIETDKAKELSDALILVREFENKVLEVSGLSKKDADWTMFRYDIRGNEVLINIEQGACG